MQVEAEVMSLTQYLTVRMSNSQGADATQNDLDGEAYLTREHQVKCFKDRFILCGEPSGRLGLECIISAVMGDSLPHRLMS